MPKGTGRSETLRLRLVAAVLAMTTLVLGGGRSVKAGFLASSADMAASRALGASFAGVQGGLLGIRTSDGFFRGSAVYLDANHILTAEHVVRGLDLSSLQVTAGSNALTDSTSSTVAKITKVEEFPTIGLRTAEIDLVVIQLSTPLLGGITPVIATAVTRTEVLAGAGFGQFGASDMGDYRELTGAASAWNAEAINPSPVVSMRDSLYLSLHMASWVSGLVGRADYGDSGGLWVNARGELVGITLRGSVTTGTSGYTDIANLTNPRIRAFIDSALSITAVPEPTSLLMISAGVIAGTAAVRRNARAAKSC